MGRRRRQKVTMIGMLAVPMMMSQINQGKMEEPRREISQLRMHLIVLEMRTCHHQNKRRSNRKKYRMIHLDPMMRHHNNQRKRNEIGRRRSSKMEMQTVLNRLHKVVAKRGNH